MPNCRICKHEYQPFITYGKQPIANGFLEKTELNKPEYFFEMKVGFCEKCKMVQLVDQPNPEQMFHDNYAFYSSTSKYMQVHFEKFASFIKENYLSKEPFVVEIGCNDGIMLQHFANAGMKHLGIEPSANVAKVAESKGINTLVKFFDEDLAEEVKAKYSEADAILSANCICHIPTLHSIAAGVKKLLKPKGVFVYEDPYMGEIIKRTSYDQVYDEHVYFFSVESVQNMYGMHGLEVIDVMYQGTHGGSMRYVIAHKGAYQVKESVHQQLKWEREIGLDKLETYKKFAENCEKSKKDLLDLLKKLKAEGKRVVGYGATSKSATVINYCGITPDLIEFISDNTPAKLGKYTPGSHIPVLPYDKFKENYPEYSLLFAWNHREEIVSKETEFKAKGGKWITYVPDVHIFE